MTSIEVLVKNIESDPTGRMITLTVEATIGDATEEIRFSEMVGNLRGLTKDEVKQRFKGILRDVLRQKIGEKEELNDKKTWKRAQDFIGDTYNVETSVFNPLSLDNMSSASYLRDSYDETKLWKITIRSGTLEITESSLAEATHQ